MVITVFVSKLKEKNRKNKNDVFLLVMKSERNESNRKWSQQENNVCQALLPLFH